jgi:hypothetical protein
MAGGNFYDVRRAISYRASGHADAVVDEIAESNYTGIQWTSHLGLTVDFLMGLKGRKSLSAPIQIIGNIDHFYLYQPRFREHGAPGLNLDVRAKTSNMLRTELGLHTAKTFTFSGGCWAPYLRLSWVTKTPLSSSTYRSSFRGLRGIFPVNTTSKGVNQVAPAIGVKVTNSTGFSLLLDTRAELNGTLKTYFADMRLDYAF